MLFRSLSKCQSDCEIERRVYTDVDGDRLVVGRGLVAEAVLKQHLNQQAGVRDDAERGERPQKDAVGHQRRQSPLGLEARAVGGPLLADDAALLAVLTQRRVHRRVGADRRRRPLHPSSSTLGRSSASAARLRTAAPADSAATDRVASRTPRGRRFVAAAVRRTVAWKRLGSTKDVARQVQTLESDETYL